FPAVGGPAGRRPAHARGGGVPGGGDVARDIALAEVGQLAVGGAQHARVLDLQLLRDVGDPALAEAFPGEEIDAARAEEIPERHLDRARVGRGHDRDAPLGGKAEDPARALEHLLEPRLACLGAVRAADERVLERGKAPLGVLGAGSGRERGGVRPTGRFLHVRAPSRANAPRWGGVSRGGTSWRALAPSTAPQSCVSVPHASRVRRPKPLRRSIAAGWILAVEAAEERREAEPAASRAGEGLGAPRRGRPGETAAMMRARASPGASLYRGVP